MTYTTIDYLPDLTASEMATASKLTFQEYTYAENDWDFRAYYGTSEDYAGLKDLFVWTAVKGATYDIFSHSFFEPFLIQVYDFEGNVIAVESGRDDRYGVPGTVYSIPHKRRPADS
ncbi:hypothetical protein G3480_24945 [Thiorhodococcus mannitoliphagus]|uniref:Uncharacterized protein n=1 Tax=Thiorhodococcus mannitoliphagus TaxID=329406 RepID=A0A6P1E4N2_9GAMM|nr:hypothetical protein [Thiorhodococcus mannitoliphagus]NEX23492.1 hypothetical protein [Thiorhodococcus mannitoliphagus]